MDKCIDKFLVNYTQGNIEKHSDSSDFDETQIPFISPKYGKHSLFDKNVKKHQEAKEKVKESLCKIPVSNRKCMQSNVRVFDENMIPVRDHEVNIVKSKKTRKQEITMPISGDNASNQLTNNTREIQDKPRPCFSNIFRRPNNNTKQISSIKEIPEDNLNSGKTFCADCERRRIKKLNRRRQSYVVQPVYTVDNMRGGPVPFGHANDRAPLSQHNHKVTRKQDSNTSYELTSSESEIERTDQRKRRGQRNFINRFQKEMRKEYLKYEKELLRNRIQQFPSKRDYRFPYQVFSSMALNNSQALNPDGTQNVEHSNIPSTSSGFWEYLFDKIRGKQMAEKDDSFKPCNCNASPTQQQPQPCTCEDDTILKLETKEATNTNTKQKEFPECKNCLQQTENLTDSSLKVDPVSKKPAHNVICKCYRNRRRKQPESLKYSQKPQSQLPSNSPGDDVNKPCQEPHDAIIRNVGEKYNGEILCIHNPPCILINGCLNLPNPKETTPIQGNFWPVTQDKKSSFYNVCRKMKRSKHGHREQASQYHPVSIEVEQALLMKPEKIVQSICNHDPPCEVVYGCYKPKYDPKLDNSCIHVPMCQRYPECMIEGRQTRESKLCEHKPKCKEVPLCSRKFVVLTARDTVGTQVRPKTKLVCRHEPPCIMIPRCLAKTISEGYLYDAIPDCVHQPCCEMIPACCRKAKDMVSVSSQYPNACRIV